MRPGPGISPRLVRRRRFADRRRDPLPAPTRHRRQRTTAGWIYEQLHAAAVRPDGHRHGCFYPACQFDPGGVGGPNASTGFEGGSLVNPWDFVFMLEGAILFAAAATRRLESSDPGALAYPFTVRPTGANNGGLSSSDEGQARAEIWMPLWERPATAGELKQLLSEGRATLRAKTARDGLGFARAIAALGGWPGHHRLPALRLSHAFRQGLSRNPPIPSPGPIQPASTADRRPGIRWIPRPPETLCTGGFSQDSIARALDR